MILESWRVPSRERFKMDPVEADETAISGQPQIAIASPEDLPDDRLWQTWDLFPVIVTVFRKRPSRIKRVGRLPRCQNETDDSANLKYPA